MDPLQLQACDRCHRRKTRCDKSRPECGPCQKSKSSCVYSERAKERTYPRSHVEKLERRIHRLEVTNRRLEAASSDRDDTRGVVLGERHRQSPASASGENEVANEVSFLSTSAGGDRFFLGPTSGIIFASLVTGSVAVDAEGDALTVSPDFSSPRRSSGLADWGHENDSLPTEQVARSLVEAYLSHDHLCYPFLHPKAIRAAVDCIYLDPSFEQSHAFEAFMFHLVLAIALSRAHKFNRRVMPDPDYRQHRAMKHLDTVLSRGGLRALQALLLLCQFRLSTSNENTTASLWHIVGVAARMCFEMGFHREAMYRVAKTRGETIDVDYLSPKFEESEVSRRCFWSVFALDRVVSITLGRPLAMSIEDIDAELPTEDLDKSASPPDHDSGSEHDASRMSPGYRTALFAHIVRYRDICGRCMTALHRGSRKLTQSEAELSRIRHELAEELQAWRDVTSRLIAPEMDLSTPLAEARSSFRLKAWYELLYHNGILLLYRPSTSSVADVSKDGSSLELVFSAAKQSIAIYAYLFRSRKINFSWMVLHAVFMAGLSYIHALSRHFRERRRHRGSDRNSIPSHCLPRDPSIVEIVNDCRACSNVLVGVSERCNTQKNCHEVFDRLSNALVQDAVESLSHSYQPRDITGGIQSRQDTSLQNTTTFAHQETPEALPVGSVSYLSTNNGALGETGGAQAGNDQQNMILDMPLAADNALRDCFPELQRMYDEQWGDDGILQLSNDWLGEIGSW